jgi:hypothetical protein
MREERLMAFCEENPYSFIVLERVGREGVTERWL